MERFKSKNFIVAILLTVLLVPCVFLLVACGGPSTTDVASYTQLVEALSSDKEVIKLTQDIVVEETIVVSRKVVIDMNGKTLSNEQDLWSEENSTWSIISVRENGDLTIKGNGKFLAKENDCYTVDVVDGANLVIENGEFVGNIHAVYVKEGTAEVKGGKFSVLQKYPEEGKENEFVLNLLNANGKEGTAKIVVTGGTFVEFNPSNNYAEGEGTNFVAEGYESVLDTEAEVETYVVRKA